MSDIPQLLAAIDGRLVELAAEITALESAKAALERPRSVGRSSAAVSDARSARSRARPRRPRRTSSPMPTAPAAPGAPPEPVISVPDGGSATTLKRSRTPTAAANGTRRRRAGGAVGAETLERLLVDSAAGLSASSIAQQAGVAYDPTLKLLRELEAAGRVRRSGSRRSTVWRVITDEERIAERAAELERRSRGLPGQRRRMARAS